MRDPRGHVVADMPALTALRAVAALLVFLYHFGRQGLEGLAGIVVGQGHVGVTVFFVLSGFLITVRYYPRFAAGEGGWAAYVVKRVARILPLYYVVLTLTHLLTSGSVPLDAAALPEWTLTQALFGSSLEGITVPTSWSLTVEECFYASAPLVFLAVAALRRRLGGIPGALVALAAATAVPYLAGSLLLRAQPSAGASSLPFLSDEHLLRSFTLFGRMPDFALGAAAGLLFLSGRVEQVWRRKNGALISSLAAAAGVFVLMAGQAGMVRDAGDPTARWGWNLVVATASTAVVLALTCPGAPLSRFLSLRPAVYLGRISFALYLIQLGPLGNHLLYRVAPGRDGVYLLTLYIGMSLVAALLYELVEEPARKTILDLWRRRSLAALPRAQSRWARGAALVIMFGALCAQHAAWALASLPPVDEARVRRVVGAESPHVLAAIASPPTAEGRPPRVRLPVSWRRGPVGDLRAPRSLLVFVEGQPVPFTGTEPFEGPRRSAYYVHGRTDQLNLPVAAPAAVTVVHYAPRVALVLAWSRLVEQPVLHFGPLLLLLGALGLIVAVGPHTGVRTTRITLSVAVGLVMAWFVSGAHLQPWAPFLLGLELAALIGLLLWSRGAPQPEPQPEREPAALRTGPFSVRPGSA